MTVSASGLTPGPHAAHIHAGSCSAQGPVQSMLADFTTDSNGRIDDDSRTVAAAPAPPPAAGWYLNLHQGTSSSILDAAGNPAASFRPLLCTDITSLASGTGSAASPPSVFATPSAALSFVTGTHFSPAPAAVTRGATRARKARAVHPPPRGRRPPSAQVNPWLILGSLPDPVVVLGRDGTFLYAAGSAAKFLGAHPAAGSRLRDIPAARTAALLGGLLAQGRPTGEHAGPWHVPGPDGQDVCLLAIATALPGEDAVVVTLRDVTLQHETQRQADSEARRLRDLAFRDELTGLPNLRHFMFRAAEAAAAGPYAPVFLDLDGFKPVNDQYGHDAGDKVLELTGKRMARAVRPDVTIARIGGDEFAAVIPAPQDPRAQGGAVALRIHGLFEKPFQLKAGTVSVRASVGTAVAGDAPTLDGVMQCADAAMYHAKENKLGPTAWTLGIPPRPAAQRHRTPGPSPHEDREI